MNMKSVFKLSLIVILLSLLIACTSNSDESVAQTPEPTPSPETIPASTPATEEEQSDTVSEELSPPASTPATEEKQSDTVSEELSPKELIFDYYCNISKTGNWEQCDEESGTVKNLATFGLEVIYYRRFAVYELIFSNGNKYTFDLQNSIIKVESGNLFYERDFLFKSYRGNVTRADADSIEIFIQSFFDSFLPFNFIEENYGVQLQLSDFNSNWEALEEKETFLYVSPEEARAAELEKLREQIVISDISYFQASSDYIDGSFKITNNTGKTIRYMTMEILYFDYNNVIIDSEFTNQGNLFNSATVTQSLINRIQGYSFSDIAYISIVITRVDFDE